MDNSRQNKDNSEHVGWGKLASGERMPAIGTGGPALVSPSCPSFTDNRQLHGGPSLASRSCPTLPILDSTMNARSVSDTPEAETLDALFRALSERAEPVTTGLLCRALKDVAPCSEKKAGELLEQQVKLGRVFRFVPVQRKAVRYWHADLATYSRQAMLSALEKPQSASDLEKALAKRLGDLTKRQRQELLDRLMEERRVYAHPKLPSGRAVKYSIHIPDPSDYLRASIGRLLKQIESTAGKLTQFGVSAHQTLEAAIRLLVQRSAFSGQLSAFERRLYSSRSA